MRAVSLFSGIGGLDLGFIQAGIDVFFAAEYDKDAVRTYERNVSRHIEQMDLAEEKNLGLEADLVFGGPPCQSFSTIGNNLNFEDPRGQLMFKFIDLAAKTGAPHVIIENVPGFKYCGAMELVKARLEQRGYPYISAEIYNSAHYEVPQKRKRVIIYATRKPDSFATFKKNMEPKSTPMLTLRDAIYDLREREDMLHVGFPPHIGQYMHYIKAGECWRALPPNVQRQVMGENTFNKDMKRGGQTGFFRRLSWDAPSPTLLTSPTQKASLLAHPDLDRPLSVEEYLRIQTFPDYFEFEERVSVNKRYKYLGNAVPVKFARAVGSAVLAGS